MHGCITAVRRAASLVVVSAGAWFGFHFCDPMYLLDDVSQLATIHYNYPYSPAPQSTSEENMEDAMAHIDATVTQLFYTSNMFHDLFYRCVLFLPLTRQFS